MGGVEWSGAAAAVLHGSIHGWAQKYCVVVLWYPAARTHVRTCLV
jgi:hypothetical protein